MEYQKFNTSRKGKEIQTWRFLKTDLFKNETDNTGYFVKGYLDEGVVDTGTVATPMFTQRWWNVNNLI